MSALLDAIQRTEAVKLGRKKVAELLTHKSGEKILLVTRSMGDILKGKGNAFISHGLEDGEACWQVETLLLSRAKLVGARFVAIKVRKTKAVYMTKLSIFEDHGRVRSNRKKNSSFQKALSVKWFKCKDESVRI